MTESPFPPSTVEEAPALEQEPEGGGRRNLVALGGLAALLVAGGAFFLLSGGEDVQDEIAFVPAKARPSVLAAAPPKVAKLPVATKIALGRNPFKALYVQPAAASTSTDAAPAGTTPVSTSPVGGATPIILVGPGSTPLAPEPFPVQQPAPQQPPAQLPAPQPPPAQQPPAAPVPAPAQVGTVSLTGVSGQGSAVEGSFRYEGRVLRGGQGDVMGGQLLVVSLTESDDGTWVVVLKRGDGGPFEVREGETVVVS